MQTTSMHTNNTKVEQKDQHQSAADTTMLKHFQVPFLRFSYYMCLCLFCMSVCIFPGWNCLLHGKIIVEKVKTLQVQDYCGKSQDTSSSLVSQAYTLPSFDKKNAPAFWVTEHLEAPRYHG